MNSIPHFSRKSTLKIQIMITLALILLSSFWFALNSQPQMRRESKPVVGEIVLSLDQALNLSLAYGDYRKVNVDWVEVA